MSNDKSIFRAKLGDSFSDFNGLEHNVVKYHDTNTVVALLLMVACGIVYGVATNTALATFLTVLYA